MPRKPTNNAKTGKTRRERRKAEKDEYRDALKEYRSFHHTNETPEYRRAKQRLDAADRRRAAWWR